VADDTAAAAGLDAVIDTTVSHSARIWNYWLGGKDNFAADREAGDRVAAMLPLGVRATTSMATCVTRTRSSPRRGAPSTSPSRPR
jgi:S-adenosyl methyltransferase